MVLKCKKEETIMPLLRMYNVGFGDSFLIKNDNASLLVDFGSIKKPKSPASLNLAAQDIRSNMSCSSEAELLITHFHSDHTNQLPQLGVNIFDKIYIRNIYRTPTTYQMSLLTFIYSCAVRDPEGQDAALLALFFVKKGLRLLKNNGKIVFVRQGSFFTVGSLGFEVLSPFLSEEAKFRGLCEELLDALFRILPSRIRDAISELQRFGDSVRKSLGDFESVSTSDIEAIPELPQEPADIIKSYFNNATRREINPIKRLLNQHNISKWEHIFNIVIVSSNERPVLLCGDENSCDMAQIVDNLRLRMRQIYLVKTPHHGSQSHYVSFRCLTPTIGLASNANRKNYQPPCCLYLHDFRAFYDTNANCQFLCTQCPIQYRYRPGCSLTVQGTYDFIF
jgi:beta-lactamase superfamily II metal-dependent hydrolase